MTASFSPILLALMAASPSHQFLFQPSEDGLSPRLFDLSTNDTNTLDQVDLAYEYQVRGVTVKDTLTLLMTR